MIDHLLATKGKVQHEIETIKVFFVKSGIPIHAIDTTFVKSMKERSHRRKSFCIIYEVPVFCKFMN